MGRDKDKLSEDWSSVLDRHPTPRAVREADAPTIIDPSLGHRMAETLASLRDRLPEGSETVADPGPPMVEDRVRAGLDRSRPPPIDDGPTTLTPLVDARGAPAKPAALGPKVRPSDSGVEVRPAPSILSGIRPPSLGHPRPSRRHQRSSASAPRPERAPARDATHIDLASALGVGPAPPPAPRPTPDRSPPATGPRTPLLPSPSLPSVLDALADSTDGQRELYRGDPGPRGDGDRDPDAPDQVHRAAATVVSVSRLLPIVLTLFMVVASGLIAATLMSGTPTAQEHVELRFLGRQGEPVRTAAASTPSRLTVVTEPAGLLVLHDREILGKTPLILDLPVALSERVGVELSGPYFERWVGEVTRDGSGAYRVDVQLKRRQY